MGNLIESAISNFVTAKRSGGDSLVSLFPFSVTEGAKNVNVRSSLTISAFYSAVDRISSTIALLPFSVMQVADKQRIELSAHPVQKILKTRPNDLMTPYNFKKIMAVAMLMRGNAYALIVRNAAGRVTKLYYLNPDEVEVFKYDKKLYYRHKKEVYDSSEILHIPAFSFNGISGRSVLEFAADNLGVSLYAQKFGADSLKDRGISQGVLESDLSVKNEKKKEISKAFSDAMSAKQKHRAPLLDEGMKYKQITLKPSEAQFIEAYAEGVRDIARWFHIPASKLAAEGEGGYNFMVQMDQDYLQSAILPLAEAIKQECNVKLFTSKEIDAGVYVYQNFKKLLQTDPKSRAQFYRELYYMGSISPNEIRELEDMNPRDDAAGNEYIQMSNVLNEMQLQKQIKNENSESNTN